MVVIWWIAVMDDTKITTIGKLVMVSWPFFDRIVAVTDFANCRATGTTLR